MEMEWLRQVIAGTCVGIMLVITVGAWRIVAALDRLARVVSVERAAKAPNR